MRLFAAAIAAVTAVTADDPAGGMSMKMPELDDEERMSSGMPAHFRCAGCAAVAWQLGAAFTAAEALLPRSNAARRLGELGAIETVESVCGGPQWDQQYGVKSPLGGGGGVGKGKMLSGPGLPAEDEPGVMAGGGPWGGRVRDMCGALTGEDGEDEFYHGVWRGAARGAAADGTAAAAAAAAAAAFAPGQHGTPPHRAAFLRELCTRRSSSCDEAALQAVSQHWLAKAAGGGEGSGGGAAAGGKKKKKKKKTKKKKRKKKSKKEEL